MDLLLLLKSAVMGIVEGATEFLPISSTGHLIIAGALLGLTGEVAKVFEIAIQTGAMFAVIWEYRARLLDTVTGVLTRPDATRFALNVFIGFAPAVALGVLFMKPIKQHLFAPVPVAIAFVLGAFVILWVEARHRRAAGTHMAGARRHRIETVDEMTPLDALKVGLLQCLAMFPGVSRSGATIIGGMAVGLSRRAATEFSFYLAIPTLIGAGVYAVYKERDALRLADAPMFAVGLVFAFVSALACIRWLIRYVATHDFTIFAWYRIAFGMLILWTAYAGWVTWVP